MACKCLFCCTILGLVGEGGMQQIGRYRIDGELGAGAQGEVFKAIDEKGQIVALKLLKPEFAGDVEVAGRFQRESRVALAIDHPNVVSAVDAGIENGRPWLAYTFVSGGDLEGHIRKHGKLSQAESLRLLRDIVAGLGALHTAGLVHRDIKPANVLLNSNGRAMITDHGLARSTCDARTQYTQTGTIVGSPAYMAPEQVEGSPLITVQADLYAAGVVFYEMLAGVIPFTGNNLIEVLNKQLESPIPDICQVVPGIDQGCARLLELFLAKKEKQRVSDPITAVEHIDALLKKLGMSEEDKTFIVAANALQETVDMSLSESAAPAVFPATLDDGGQIFPATLDETTAQSFPATLDEGTSFPATLDEGSAFPATLDEATVFPATLPEGESPNRFDAAGFQPTLMMETVCAEQSLTAVPDSARAGEARLRLAVSGPAGEQQVFIYAGTTLRMGRTGLDRTNAEVCLRLRPAQGNEQQIRRISGHHLTLTLSGDKATLIDEQSSGGTQIAGTAVVGTTALQQHNDIHVAGVVHIAVEHISAQNIHYTLPELGESDASAGALLVTRPENGSDHSYALITGSVAVSDLFSESGTEETPSAIVTLNDGLWLTGGELGLGKALALIPGVRFSINNHHLQVCALEPADQK